MQGRLLESFIIGDSKNEISLRPSAPSQQLLPSRFNVFNALTIVFGRFPSPSPLPRGFSGHVARPSRSIQRFNDSTLQFFHPVFLAIRSMSAIGIICHWNLVPAAATRFRSSIIIAVIVLPHRGRFRRGPLMRNTCSK